MFLKDSNNFNVATANTLTTSRTINGTSFNGSSNITTANWGTARTLTIGNTGKSVNGSGNVSWSLSEIGAAPAGYGLGTTCTDKSGQDCNNILVTGFYRGSNMTNKPSGCTQGWIYLLVMSHDNSSWVRQVAYDFGTASQVYTRVKQNGSWTAWVATDTNTWRGVQDNLTSTATDQSLSANQGKVLKGLIDGKAASSHTHNYAGSSSAGGAANSATKLATARSINGTNFDGTGNITTANWGTARNLQIGNTAKSVNGSANVTWTLSEIGAAPTSHNHTSLTGVTNIAFAAAASDSASMGIAVSDDKTYFDFNLSDDANADMWRWRFGAWDSSTSSTKTFNAMTLTATSPTAAKLTVSGTVQASTFSGALSGNASTATKLQTARSINGTIFDGTGNITTANWGTARNIQIGNTSKSVNGSGNVSWTLSEIGAAPASHTHDGRYIKGNNILLSVESDILNSSALTTSRKQLIAGSADKVYAGNTSANLILESSSTPKVSMNNNFYPIYHAGNKPTASEIGAAASNHTHSYLPLGGGTLTGNLTVQGQTTLGATVLNNNTSLYGYNKSGTRINICGVDTSNNIYLGWNNETYINVNNTMRTYRDLHVLNGAAMRVTGQTVLARTESYRQIAVVSTAGDGNGQGDGQTHLGYFDNGYHHYFRGSGAMHVDMLGGLKIGGKRLSIGSSAHSNPATGDVWIQV